MFLGHFIKNACYLLFLQVFYHHACEGAAEDGGNNRRIYLSITSQ